MGWRRLAAPDVTGRTCDDPAMHPAAAAAITDLEQYADPAAAAARARFFKTGPGEYGEGDVFLGATVPQVRAVHRRHRELPLEALGDLLASPVHEPAVSDFHWPFSAK